MTASRCRSGREERLTLLGDAAHPMLPHLGQGANQSIEDGMALATILARATGATAPRPFRHMSAFVANVWLRSSAGPARMVCDTILSMRILSVRDAELAAHAAFRKRLYDHDVVPEAQAVAAEL